MNENQQIPGLNYYMKCEVNPKLTVNKAGLTIVGSPIWRTAAHCKITSTHLPTELGHIDVSFQQIVLTDPDLAIAEPLHCTGRLSVDPVRTIAFVLDICACYITNVSSCRLDIVSCCANAVSNINVCLLFVSFFA